MRPLLDLLVPPLCDGCGAPSPPPWCEACDRAHRATRPTDPCRWCGIAAGPGHPCWAGEPPLAGLVTLGAWTGGVATAVARAKVVGRREVLRAAGQRLGVVVAAARSDLAGPGAVVVAVPTDRGRARRRGADHTAALAWGVARSLGASAVRPFGPLRGAPDRVTGSRPVFGTGVVAAPVVPSVVSPSVVGGRTVVLVDDVVTSGATVAAVAGALARHGAIVLAAVVGRAGARTLEAAHVREATG